MWRKKWCFCFWCGSHLVDGNLRAQFQNCLAVHALCARQFPWHCQWHLSDVCMCITNVWMKHSALSRCVSKNVWRIIRMAVEKFRWNSTQQQTPTEIQSVGLRATVKVLELRKVEKRNSNTLIYLYCVRSNNNNNNNSNIQTAKASSAEVLPLHWVRKSHWTHARIQWEECEEKERERKKEWNQHYKIRVNERMNFVKPTEKKH